MTGTGSDMRVRSVEMPSPMQKTAHCLHAVVLAREQDLVTPLRTRCWQRCQVAAMSSATAGGAAAKIWPVVSRPEYDGAGDGVVAEGECAPAKEAAGVGAVGA
eukprot:2989005-Ditylum_brightwellii.AAC.1